MGIKQYFARVFRAASTRSSLSGTDGSWGGLRDLNSSFGYQASLTIADFRKKAKRNGVASRIIKAYPEATWRGQDVELIEDPNPESVTPFEQSWDLLNRTFKAWAKLKRADRLASMGRYSVILLGTEETGQALEQPLENLPMEQLRYLACFDEDDAKIQEWETNPTEPLYGQPKLYKLKRLTESKGGRAQATNVHASRIIHIPGNNQLDDDWYGEPILEAVWNDLADLEKVKGAGAEAFWLRVHQGYVLNIDPEVEVDAQGETELQEEAENFVHGFQRFMRTRGVSVTPLGSDVANYGPNVAATIGVISAATGIPQRILMGSERGQLASTQDDDNWAQRITDRRHEYAEPWIVRPFVERLIALTTLEAPEVIEGADSEAPLHQFTVAWPKLQDLSIDKRLDVAGKAAKLNKDAGDIIITPAEIRNDFLEMEPLTEEQLAEVNAIKETKAAEKQAELEAIARSKGIEPGTPAGPPKPGAPAAKPPAEEVA